MQRTLVERLLEVRRRCRTESLVETWKDVPSSMLVAACNSTWEAGRRKK